MIEGRGAFTIVNGEPCPMDPAALVLTPQWCWHDHANETDHPVIWLDVLDVPFVMDLNQWFFEQFPKDVQPRARPVSVSTLVYPWERMEAALAERAAADRSDGGVSVEYTNPETGGPVLPTIGCHAQMLRPGGVTRPRRTNASAVLHVVRGRGRTLVGDQKLEWEQGDVLAIPHWTWVQHENRSAAEPAFLFGSTDTPILQAFGIHREEVGAGPRR
jgi:gentisate 1,2-dioxygenase